jgi:hypothetical protein
MIHLQAIRIQKLNLHYSVLFAQRDSKSQHRRKMKIFNSNKMRKLLLKHFKMISSLKKVHLFICKSMNKVKRMIATYLTLEIIIKKNIQPLMM